MDDDLFDELKANLQIAELQCKLGKYRKALEEIATRMNEDGEKVDFFQEIAREALGDD